MEYTQSKNKLLIILGIGLFFLPIATMSFAEIPSGPIEIIVKNVTINTPPSNHVEEKGFFDDVISQALLILSATITAAIGLLFKFIQDKKTPTTLEQEKIFNDTIQEAYYQSYLPVWEKIWSLISSKRISVEQEAFINTLWEDYLTKKQLPTMDQLKQMNNEPIRTEAEINLARSGVPSAKEHFTEIELKILEYAEEKAKHFKLNSITSDENLMIKKMEHLIKIADVKYYNYVIDNISKVVEKAVLSTEDVNRDILKKDRVDEWNTKAMTELKRLMIFAFMREDLKIMKTLVMAEINKVISQRIKPEDMKDRVART